MSVGTDLFATFCRTRYDARGPSVDVPAADGFGIERPSGPHSGAHRKKFVN